MARILILGAGVYQAPLIRRARQRGIETVVLSSPGPYPGIELADHFLPVDITDTTAVVQAARDHHVAGVVTAGTDHGMPALGAVVEALDLPGPGAKAARRSRDKQLMKKAFLDGGVPCARGEAHTDAGPALAAAEILGFPVVVKPAASSGSRGVTVVADTDGFPAAWETARAVAGDGPVLVEEFLEGLEFGAQAVVHGDRVVDVILHNDTVTDVTPPTPIGHSLPADLPAGAADRTRAVVEKAVAALGLTDCIANCDLMLTDGNPRVIELGGRIGATGLPEVIARHHRWDVYGHLLSLALGDYPGLPAPAGEPGAVLLLRSERTGRVKSLEVPADIANHPNLVDLQWDIAVGDAVRAFRVGPDRIGHLQVTGPNARAADRLAAEFQARITVEVEVAS